MTMTCERCGHELEPAGYAQVWCEHEVTKCIANLRADLVRANARLDDMQRSSMEMDDYYVGELRLVQADLEAERARSVSIEVQCAAMRAVCEVTRARLLGRNDPLLDQLEKASHDDAGRDLLTAVRRLMYEAEEVRAWLVLFADLDVRGSDSAAGFAQRLCDALADPALAVLDVPAR